MTRIEFTTAYLELSVRRGSSLADVVEADTRFVDEQTHRNRHLQAAAAAAHHAVVCEIDALVARYRAASVLP